MDKAKKKKLTLYLVTKLAWLFVLALGKTARLEIKNIHYWHQAKYSAKPVLFSAWHGKMLIPIYVNRNQNIYAMVSEHNDGEMIAKTIIRLGYRTVRGSSTRGGHKAFREMLKILKKGNNCAVLPDGPNGPRFEFKLGSILLAQRSQALILPMTFAAKKKIVINSWDRFTFWWPFSKVYCVYGKPLTIPRNISASELEAYRQYVETSMQQLEEEADALV